MSEDQRLLAVKQFSEYNLQVDDELQQLISMASEICHAPIALITLIGEDKQWLKVRKGTDVEQTPLNVAFCAHAIQKDELMIVPDMLDDKRFADNPFVVNEPNVRFYAGAPLTSRDGHRLGTLCVIDQKPHELDEHQKLMLTILSKHAIKIMELRLNNDLLIRSTKELEEHKHTIRIAEIRLRSFFENSANFHVLLDKQGCIMDYNKTAYSFIKNVHGTKLFRGDKLIDFLDPDFKQIFSKNFEFALNGKSCTEEGSTDYGDKGGVIYWEAAFEPARNNEDEIIGISYVISNITKRKQYEKKILSQNRSLLNIAHIQAHEIRGPLTTVMGMMNLVKAEEHNLPEVYIELLDEAINKLDDKIHNILSKVDKLIVE